MGGFLGLGRRTEVLKIYGQRTRFTKHLLRYEWIEKYKISLKLIWLHFSLYIELGYLNALLFFVIRLVNAPFP